jgi:hypothetical protein
MDWPRKCRLCGEEFESKDIFKKHLEERHISELTFIEQQKMFEDCGKEKETKAKP